MPGNEVARVEAGLLDVAEVVVGVAVEGEPPHLVTRELLLRPHLGQVERVDRTLAASLGRHDLHAQRPRGELAPLDGLDQVELVAVRVEAGQLGGLRRVERTGCPGPS